MITYPLTCFLTSYLLHASADCPDNDDHNVNTMDALTLMIPVVLKYHAATKEVRDKAVLDCIHVTRRTGRGLDRYALLFADMLVDVLHGKGKHQIKSMQKVEYFIRFFA